MALISRRSPVRRRLRCSFAFLALFVWWFAPATSDGAPPLSNADGVLATLAAQLQDQNIPIPDRLSVIQVFKDWATAQVRAPLVAALSDPAPEIRVAAADALGWSGNREAVEALQKRLQAPGETGAVRAAVLTSLGRIGEPSARQAVVEATSHPDSQIREAALWSVALGSLQDSADRAGFLRRLVSDRVMDPLFRSQAVEALAEIKDTAAIDILEGVLRDDPRWDIAVLPSSANQQEVMGLRYRQARDVPAWAARALGLLEARRALPLVLKAAEEPRDFFLRFMAVGTLVSWNAPEAYPVFQRRLRDPFPDVRVSALIGIAQAGDKSAVDAVLQTLSDPQSKVRAQAITTLGELGERRARQPIEALVDEDPDPAVQRAAEIALARLAP